MAGEPDGRGEADSADAGGIGLFCRRCGESLVRGAIAAEQRACCLNATPIAGVCPTHGPVGPHHAVDDPGGTDTE
ncbi:hypothetical protein [Halorubrum pallidum]